MSRRPQIEKEKLKKNALIGDGFGRGFSLNFGLVVGGDGLGVATDLESHGLVIPWAGCPHIRIVISADR